MTRLRSRWLHGVTRCMLALVLANALALASAGVAEASTGSGADRPASTTEPPSHDVDSGTLVTGAHRWVSSYADQCPPVTDSIDRLYSAYFQRAPDQSGWEYWSMRYAQYEAGLATMSQSFADSAEFKLTYGALDNAEFVTLVYRNVMQRDPDPAGFAHWVSSLDAGYPRGSVMIAFSESEEYVTLTGTTAPLAGYLQWYSEPVRFVCGYGDQIATPYTEFRYLDFLIANLSDQEVDWQWSLRNSHSGGDILVQEPAMPAQSYVIYWNVAVHEILPGTWGVIFENGDRFDMPWMAVMHDSAHAPDRHPWDLPDDAP